jgi:hypothetical protein
MDPRKLLRPMSSACGLPVDDTPPLLLRGDRLWLACAGVPGTRRSKPTGPGTFEAAVVSALGRDAQRRLVGCLEDLIFPGMIGDVRSARAVPLATVSVVRRRVSATPSSASR